MVKSILWVLTVRVTCAAEEKLIRYGAFEIVTQGSFAFLPIAATFNNLEITIWHRQENIIRALWRLASQSERIKVHLVPLEIHHPTPDDDPVVLAKQVQALLTAVLYPNQIK